MLYHYVQLVKLLYILLSSFKISKCFGTVQHTVRRTRAGYVVYRPLVYYFLLLSTFPVRHWRAYTKGSACTRCLPKAIGT